MSDRIEVQILKVEDAIVEVEVPMPGGAARLLAEIHVTGRRLLATPAPCCGSSNAIPKRWTRR